MPHTETKLESKEIFDGHVIHVTLDTVRLEDGRTSLREVVHHHGGACVLPIDDGEFADRPRDPNAQPMAPKTTERIHDGDDFAFGKIEF